MKEIKELFDDFDSNTISVKDFGIVVRGTLVTHIHKEDNGSISIYSGNLDDDKYAERLNLDKSEMDYVFETILELV